MLSRLILYLPKSTSISIASTVGGIRAFRFVQQQQIPAAIPPEQEDDTEDEDELDNRRKHNLAYLAGIKGVRLTTSMLMCRLCILM